MKKILLLVLSFMTLQLSAQQETLFDDLEVLGAFGGPILEVGSINGEVGADVGGGGALILNRFFFGGYGMGTEYPEYSIESGENAGDYNIQFRHGGLWFGATSKTGKLIHFYSSLKVGWGRTRLKSDGDTIFSDRTFVLTPEAGFEVNVTDFFKLGFTAGYRWVDGINQLPGLENNDFSSPVGILTFRFGGFGDDWDWDW